MRPRGTALRAAGAALTAGFLAACAGSSQVITGAARPPTTASQVAVYPAAPPIFKEIAVLQAFRKTLFGDGGERSTDKIVQRLKVEAAKLGANGLILGNFDQEQTGSVGSGVGSDSYSAHGSVSLGLGAFVGVYKTSGKARAIYVPPG